MFGAFGAARFMKMRDEAKSARHRTVTRAEFIEAMIKNGATREQAEFQAKISVAFGTGASALIGNEMLSIKEE